MSAIEKLSEKFFKISSSSTRSQQRSFFEAFECFVCLKSQKIVQVKFNLLIGSQVCSLNANSTIHIWHQIPNESTISIFSIFSSKAKTKNEKRK
jgi:hypothetical protein